MAEKNSGNNNIFILTIDLEEWYHILDLDSIADHNKWEHLEVRIYDNTYKILDILGKKKIKATFFVLGWIAKKFPDLVRHISDQGHEIGSHSQNHILIYKSDYKSFKYDLQESIDTIQSIINKKVVAFRAPGFSIKEDSLWAFKIIAEAGILIDSSIFPAMRAHGGIKQFRIDSPFLLKIGEYIIQEFPINIFKLGFFKFPFSGGGYFRIIPFYIFKYFANRSNYVMTYFHPRDFDPYQPLIEGMSFIKKFKSYYGLSKSFDKLCNILGKFTFVNISSASKLIDWKKVPLVEF